MQTRQGPVGQSVVVGVRARRPRRFGGVGGMPAIRRVLRGQGFGWWQARGWARHRGWSCGEVGVLAPEVVEQDGEGFCRVVEFFRGHGNGPDSRDADWIWRRFGGALTGILRTTSISGSGGTGMRIVRIAPDRRFVGWLGGHGPPKCVRAGWGRRRAFIRIPFLREFARSCRTR